MHTECLADLLPENIDAKLLPTARTVAERLCHYREQAEELSRLRNGLEVDARYLDTLAEEMQTYFLSQNESEAHKRSAVFHSLFIHRIKGTVGAIERGLGSFGLDIRVIPWHEYDGEPWRYRLTITPYGHDLTRQTITAIGRMLREIGSVRDHLDRIDIRLPRIDVPVGVSQLPVVVAIRPYASIDEPIDAKSIAVMSRWQYRPQAWVDIRELITAESITTQGGYQWQVEV